MTIRMLIELEIEADNIESAKRKAATVALEMRHANPRVRSAKVVGVADASAPEEVPQVELLRAQIRFLEDMDRDLERRIAALERRR